MAYDEVVQERCPKCGGGSFKNIFHLKEGTHARVYVECARCGDLVARYLLRAYVDPHHDFSSTLKMLHRTGDYGDSLRTIQEDLGAHQDQAQVQFDDIKARLKESPRRRDEKIYDIILNKGIMEDE